LSNRDAAVSVADPEAQQIFRHSLCAKVGDTVSPEGMEAALLAAHLFQDFVLRVWPGVVQHRESVYCTRMPHNVVRIVFLPRVEVYAANKLPIGAASALPKKPPEREIAWSICERVGNMASGTPSLWCPGCSEPDIDASVAATMYNTISSRQGDWIN